MDKLQKEDLFGTTTEDGERVAPAGSIDADAIQRIPVEKKRMRNMIVEMTLPYDRLVLHFHCPRYKTDDVTGLILTLFENRLYDGVVGYTAETKSHDIVFGTKKQPASKLLINWAWQKCDLMDEALDKVRTR
jgi:hypothetical protein